MVHETEDHGSVLLKLWSLYSSGQFKQALQELANTLGKGSDDFELLYLYALVAKKSGNITKAIEVFQNILERTDEIADDTRRAMLRHIVISHINHLSSGRWFSKEGRKDGHR